MPDRRPIHPVPTAKGWGNRREGSSRVSKHYRTKAEAQAAGRNAARSSKVEHVIHKKDGTIGEKNSYGSDPRSRKG